jgi:hypothetical protein
MDGCFYKGAFSALSVDRHKRKFKEKYCIERISVIPMASRTRNFVRKAILKVFFVILS